MTRDFTQKHTDELKSVYDSLVNIEFFNFLTKDELIDICSILKEKKFSEGTKITEYDATETDFYILSKGVVDMYKRVSTGESYVISVLNKDGKGAFFGEEALIEEYICDIEIIAKTNVVLYSVNGNKFTNFCNDNPIIGYKVFKILSKVIYGYLRECNNNSAILFNALIEEVEKTF